MGSGSNLKNKNKSLLCKLQFLDLVKIRVTTTSCPNIHFKSAETIRK